MRSKEDAFEKFILHSWAKHENFQGVSRICAILLNVLWGIVKVFLCVIIMLVLWPHIGVSSLRDRKDLNVFQKVLLFVCLFDPVCSG